MESTWNVPQNENDLQRNWDYVSDETLCNIFPVKMVKTLWGEAEDKNGCWTQEIRGKFYVADPGPGAAVSGGR